MQFFCACVWCKKSKVLNHAGNTTYKTQSYHNSIMTKKVNLKVYQSTKIDTQRYTTDKKLGGGWKYRLAKVSDKYHWVFKPGLGAPNLTLIQ